MKNRSLVVTLGALYAGYVLGVSVFGTSARLLGSLTFFSEPSTLQKLESFDRDGNDVPDFVNAERILEIFVSAPQWLTPLVTQPPSMPGMIRIDDRFFAMPDSHTAAPAVTTQEDYSAFDAVEPLWTSDTIELSPEFEGGERSTAEAPTPFLVSSGGVSSVTRAVPISSTASSRATTTVMPGFAAPAASTSTSASTASTTSTSTTSSSVSISSTASAISSIASSVMSPASSAISSFVMNSCSDGINSDGDMFTDLADMDGGTQCDTVASSSSSSFSMANSCSDGINSDGDMFTDLADMDGGTQCDTVASSSSSSFSMANSCSDGINSDGDMFTDLADMDGGSQCDTIGSSSTGFMPF